ncbi:MAG TPA: ATP synthase F0 subunit A [Planctomycetes bacterium]|nr:F0F1 ATP synthase subunit A [Planctomycetota bacterium]HIL53143.1 ATP synthase F0 subunit A [Planctomycetota bacterium]
MNLLRPILALAVIAGAIAFSGKYAEHHENSDPFQQLYLHLMPARLVQQTDAAHGDEAHAEAAHGGGHGAAASLVALPLPAILAPAGRAVDHGYELYATNLQVFQLASVLLIFILLGGIPGYLRTGRGDWLTRLFCGFAMYIRDDMVVPVMGKATGNKYLPYFLSIFFFILFINLMGLVPGSATATASIFVTGALATITLGSMVLCGMIVQGPVAFWRTLVPEVPLLLWPLMFVVEVVGLVVKPFALMVRLFANMTGGHMVVLSFMGLIFYFGQSMGDAAGYAASPVAVGFAVFIMIIESFVALLQAYIFTQLSIIFVNGSIHPEH